MEQGMSSDTRNMEHRLGTRVRLDAAGKLRAGAATVLHAVVIDASLSGAFVQVPARLPLLARVQLRVYAGSGDWIEACVVRRAADGVGVEWLDPGSQAVCQVLAGRDPAQAAPAPRSAVSSRSG
jgi:PilZ domain